MSCEDGIRKCARHAIAVSIILVFIYNSSTVFTEGEPDPGL